jgi:hypothetical protein
MVALGAVYSSSGYFCIPVRPYRHGCGLTIIRRSQEDFRKGRNANVDGFDKLSESTCRDHSYGSVWARRVYPTTTVLPTSRILFKVLCIDCTKAEIDGGGVFKVFFAQLYEEVYDTSRALRLARQKDDLYLKPLACGTLTIRLFTTSSFV